MPIAPYIYSTMNSRMSSVIRRMFEEGAILKKKYGEDAVFDFSIGNPDLEPPKGVVKAIEETAALRVTGSHGYMPNAGYPETRSAMAQKVGREQGAALAAQNVVMTAGAAAALTCVLKAILSPGDEVIVSAPFFPEYAHYAANHRGVLKPVSARPDFSLDIAAIGDALSEKTACVLINSPNNPSGKVYSQEDIIALAETLTAHGKKTGRLPYLVCDEPYRDIVYGGKKVAAVFPHYSAAAVVSSFAKNLSIPGERIGYIAANPAMSDRDDFIAACIFANRILGFVNAPAFFQRVVAASWDSPVDYSLYTERRNMLMAVLDKAGYEYAVPEGAFYLFVKVPAKKGFAQGLADDMGFCDHLKSHLALCAPGAGFGCPGWFRMAYCVSKKTIEHCGGALQKAREAWQ
ncbi:MAG: pyridoxal phosphate-dependent aminotransferase [Treponema sp.]|jgi:aspartate aminotransferase|nr:pyridoxal phosphate-dependent aminotransferase [Treponema sp.]